VVGSTVLGRRLGALAAPRPASETPAASAPAANVAAMSKPVNLRERPAPIRSIIVGLRGPGITVISTRAPSAGWPAGPRRSPGVWGMSSSMEGCSRPCRRIRARGAHTRASSVHDLNSGESHMPEKTSKPATRRQRLRKPKVEPRTPTHEEIAQRAYFIALKESGADELGNWLRAERELMAA
jgi:hypothetical protein